MVINEHAHTTNTGGAEIIKVLTEDIMKVTRQKKIKMITMTRKYVYVRNIIVYKVTGPIIHLQEIWMPPRRFQNSFQTTDVCRLINCNFNNIAVGQNCDFIYIQIEP